MLPMVGFLDTTFLFHELLLSVLWIMLLIICCLLIALYCYELSSLSSSNALLYFVYRKII